MPKINPDRLLSDLRELRQFGACGTGVVRQSLSQIDIASRRWLVQKMKEAGLNARIDGIGTVFGRSRAGGKALLIGSHTDTQPTGGWLDGAMGVIYGLEIARALAESPDTRDLAVDVASWIDEEGTFASFIGSRSFVGEDVERLIEHARAQDGQSMRDAIRAAGLQDEPRVQLDEGRYVAYLEPHIEQGGYLEATRKRIGVVTTIVGIRELEIVFVGQQNHAGTTPMKIRKDAAVALFAFACQVNSEFGRIAGPQTVWTIGQVELHPGAPSIVPGRAELILQFRDPDAAKLDELQARALALVQAADAAGPVRITATALEDAVAPTVMDARLQQHIAAAAELHARGAWMHMPSGAGHDAQVIATRLPCCMLFVPSIAGISHDFAEDTADEDIVLGCEVATTAAASILRAGTS
jgi:beta-ureidopropionase / N-carbamoyl-L-amino-acid hydrolase